MKKITIHEALTKIQNKENVIIKVNKMVYSELKCYEGQTYMKEKGRMGTIKIKNNIIVHPKIKFIYLYK